MIAGLVALAAFGYLLVRQEKVNPEHAIYSFGLLAFSVVFLLHIRQCRYYAFSILLGLLSYMAYQRFVAERRIIQLVLLTVCAVVFFYNNYLLAGGGGWQRWGRCT